MSVTHQISKTCVGSGGSVAGTYSQVGASESTVDTTIVGSTTNQLVAASYGPGGTSTGNLLSIEIVSSQPITLKTNSGAGVADVQTLTITGTPTGGTFPLVFGGAVTTAIAYNASAATVQAALRALSTIGGTNITCTGGPLPGTPVVCTFSGTMATGLRALMTTESGDLTGGSTPAATVAHTTPGTPQETLSLAAGIPITWDVSGPHPCPFAGSVSAWYVTTTNAARLRARILIA